jgi:hypothetical protein
MKQTEVVDRLVYAVLDLLVVKVDLNYWFAE